MNIVMVSYNGKTLPVGVVSSMDEAEEICENYDLALEFEGPALETEVAYMMWSRDDNGQYTISETVNF